MSKLSIKSITQQETTIYALMTVLFGVAVWCFWSLAYPCALGFQEQLQLFLFDSEYWQERVAMPAGVARYCAEFLVQLYNKVAIGGLIIAAVYVSLQILTWLLVRKECRSRWLGYTLSFIPSLMMWFYMSDEMVKLTFPIALLMALLAMVGYTYAKRHIVSYTAYLLLMTPVLAWIAGPTVLVFALYVALDGLRKPRRYGSLLMIIYAPLLVRICGYFAPVPVYRLFYGINYSMVVEQLPLTQCIIMAVTALLPLLILLIPQMDGKKAKLAWAGTAVVLIAIAATCITKAYSTPDYEVMEYDSMVRAQQWDKIIHKAEKKSPDSPLTVAALNLALAIKGELTTRAGEFYQNGWAGAFPTFNKNYQSSLMTAETYFYLGLINTAMRLDFEAMEALPDNAKSARLVKRLAETNLINGQYDVARKYLLLLQKTMFFSKWATETMKLLGNDKAIDAHPLYGHLRQLRLDNDFFFSEPETDKIMGQLVMQNHNNSLAAQYLLLLPQLEGNRQKYMMYMDFLKKTLDK